MNKYFEKAFVDRDGLCVEGVRFVHEEKSMLFLPKNKSGKGYVILGLADLFLPEYLLQKVKKSQGIHEFSVVNASDDQVNDIESRAADLFFPYVSAVNYGNIFRNLNSELEELAVKEISEISADMHEFRAKIFATMAERFFKYCPPDKEGIMREMHEKAFDLMASQPGYIFFHGEKPLGYLSWKIDQTSWKVPIIISSHFVDTECSKQIRSAIHSECFAKLRIFDEVKVVRIHAKNRESRRFFAQNNYIQNESLFLRYRQL